MFKKVEFIDADSKYIRITTADKQEIIVPKTLENRDYAALQASGAIISGYARPAPTSEDIRMEAQRRIMASFGARDAAQLAIVISNNSRAAIRMLLKNKGKLTKAQAAQVVELERLDTAIKAIREASDILEANPPANYHNDKYWP